MEWIIMCRLRPAGSPPGLAETIFTAFVNADSKEEAIRMSTDNLTLAQARMVVETRVIEVTKMTRHSGSSAIVIPDIRI